MEREKVGDQVEEGEPVREESVRSSPKDDQEGTYSISEVKKETSFKTEEVLNNGDYWRDHVACNLRKKVQY